MNADPKAGADPWCYLGIFKGIVQVIAVDLGDEATASAVSDIVLDGGVIERVPLDVARVSLFEEWPIKEASRGK